MTTPMNKADDGVHRLVDMVVEEVSLVDRAANKHRFLIVKRDDAMDDNTPAEKATTDGADASMTPSADATWTVADGSPLGAALAALESLTAIVELLGSLGADSNDLRLASLRRDREWVERAREVAFELVDASAGLGHGLDHLPLLRDEVGLFLGDEEEEFLLKG